MLSKKSAWVYRQYFCKECLKLKIAVKSLFRSKTIGLIDHSAETVISHETIRAAIYHAPKTAITTFTLLICIRAQTGEVRLALILKLADKTIYS